MKVLLSAYACEPGRGSEPEVGYRTMLAAASAHEVWVLTRDNNVPTLEKDLNGHPRRARIHLEGLDVPGLPLRIRRQGLPGLHLYYDLWQRAAARRAAELDGRVGFDLVHHATFANFWLRVGVVDLGKTLVWGPVGGGLHLPKGLLMELGLGGLLEEVGRKGFRRLMAMRGFARRNLESSSVVLVQNTESARLVGSGHCVVVLPNAAAISVDAPVQSHRQQDIAFVGRLVPLKAGTLAVRTMQFIRHSDARLFVCGEGPDQPRMERLAHRLRVKDRVVFMGRVPREEVLARISASAVLLHTSLHEEAGMSVAEALALGTPVVALDHGGPRELVRLWKGSPAVLVPPATPQVTARRLAAAVDGFLGHPTAASPRGPVVSFRDTLLETYETAPQTERFQHVR